MAGTGITRVEGRKQQQHFIRQYFVIEAEPKKKGWESGLKGMGCGRLEPLPPPPPPS